MVSEPRLIRKFEPGELVTFVDGDLAERSEKTRRGREIIEGHEVEGASFWKVP